MMHFFKVPHARKSTKDLEGSDGSDYALIQCGYILLRATVTGYLAYEEYLGGYLNGPSLVS